MRSSHYVAFRVTCTYVDWFTHRSYEKMQTRQGRHRALDSWTAIQATSQSFRLDGENTTFQTLGDNFYEIQPLGLTGA